MNGFQLKTLESVETYVLLMVHRRENQLRLVGYLPLFTGFEANIQPVVGLGISEPSTPINLQPIESPLIFAVTYNVFESSTPHTGTPG